MKAGYIFIGCIGIMRMTVAASQEATEGHEITLTTSSAWSEPTRSDASGGVSDGLDLRKSGEWVLAPIPFKSALLGSGVKVGAARIYRDQDSSDADGDSATRDSIFGVGGMYAERGSWALAGFDRRYWSQERWRSTVAAGVGELNYELQTRVSGADLQLPVTQKMTGGTLALDRNLYVNGWVGGGIQLARSPVGIANLPANISDLSPELTYEILAINLHTEWDTRSDQFFPEAGTQAQLEVSGTHTRNDFTDSRFVRYKIAYNAYHAFGARNVLAWRGAFETVTGNAPFFALPWFGAGADLRGYSPGRFIGHTLAAVQAEWRWEAGHRFGLVAFAGVGGVYGEVQNSELNGSLPVGGVGGMRGQVLSFEQNGFLPAAGVGLRWRVTRVNHINLRVDYARGRGDDSLLVAVGEAF